MFDRDEVFIGSFGYAESGAKVINLPYMTIEKYASQDNFNADSLIMWAYNHGKMVSRFDENGMPESIIIKNDLNEVKVMQVFYDWEGMQASTEVYHFRSETVKRQEDIIDV